MLGQILKLVLAGIAGGVVGSIALTRLVASQVRSVTPTFVSVSLLLVAVCLLASLIPAIRATSVDPAETCALRRGNPQYSRWEHKIDIVPLRDD
jgi:hypothetical protein